jgi:hypothetical protein
VSEEPSSPPVQVTGEEHSRPVFRLLARAAILLAQRHKSPPPAAEPAPVTEQADEEGDHA